MWWLCAYNSDTQIRDQQIKVRSCAQTLAQVVAICWCYFTCNCVFVCICVCVV